MTLSNIIEIKERASDKVYSIYLSKLRESLQPNKYWSIDPERAKELEKAFDKEVEMWSYILTLIEKDNKL
jgi:hypothetical protein